MSVAGTITDNDEAIKLKSDLAEKLGVDNRNSFWRFLAIKTKKEAKSIIAEKLALPDTSNEVLYIQDKLEDLKFSGMI
jgi:hypothetical protein